MKKAILIILIGLAFCADAFSQQKRSDLQIADSLYTLKQWKPARERYLRYLKDTSTNAIAWNRLGYSNYSLGLYDEALKDYQKALASKPSPPVRSVIITRTAKVYSLLNKTNEATEWLVKIGATGYNIQPDLDTLADFKNVRQAANYKDIKKKVYESVYPCAAEPRAHDFDFWVGEWEVYQTGTKFLVGHSSVQSIAGECGLLENWTSTQAQTGKSINYYNPSTGKWEQDWIGSGGGPQRYLNGEYKDNAMHFTYESTNAKGQKVTGNFKFYNIDKDTVRQYQDVNNDDGKTVTVSYDLTYVRKKQ
jgi:tetratricopeptide (TPR) repeat protein